MTLFIKSESKDTFKKKCFSVELSLQNHGSESSVFSKM